MRVVTFLFVQLDALGGWRWIRLVKTNKIGCLVFFLGPKRCIHLKVKVCLSLSSLKSSARRNFFLHDASPIWRPALDSSRQDEQDRLLGFFPRPKKMYTPRSEGLR